MNAVSPHPLEVVIDRRLDEDQRFPQLQGLVDAEAATDLLSVDVLSEREGRWQQVRSLTQTLLGQYRDVRLQILLYRSELALAGLCQAFEYLSAWNISLVDESAGPDDDTRRAECEDQELLAAVLCYFVSNEHLGDLRHAWLNRDAGVAISEVFEARAQRGAAGVSVAAKRGAAQDINAWVSWLRQQPSLVPAVRSAQAVLRLLETWLASNNPMGLEILAAPVYQWFGKLEEILISFGAPVPAIAQEDNGSRDAALDRTGPHNLDVASMNRQDVVSLLELICHWFAKHEPSHPAPYFFRRGLRLMDVDFMVLMQDMFPDTVSQFEKLAGLEVKK
jgi:type VI secretion system protein ImpA